MSSIVGKIIKIGSLGLVAVVFVSLQFGTGVAVVDSTVDDVAEPIANYSASTEANATAVERMVHAEVNREREANGLQPIAYDDELAAIAAGHSEDMAEGDYVSHTQPDGDGMRERYNQAGYACSGGGENVAQTWWRESIDTGEETVEYDTEQELAAGIVAQWMQSPGHRKNILRTGWRVEGIGVEITNSGEVFVTQNFC